jgi:hypothetical protein
LDLSITVGPEKPGHIKAILSGPFPILVNYKGMYRDITGSALWRMRAALKQHRDRVREIAFEGTRANFDKFFAVTNCAFPVLESLVLRFRYGDEPKLPDTFLRGPNLSDLHLRRLTLNHFSLASVSGLLLSATALTDLFLIIDTAFSTSPEASLLACLQGMPYLRRLDLSISSESPSQPSTPQDIIPLPKLTRFRYDGHSVFLDALVAGLSAPSLRDVNIRFVDVIRLPMVHLLRFINEIEERYHAAHVTFQHFYHLWVLTQSEYISHCEPRFALRSPSGSPESLMRMGSVLSTRLTIVEDLSVSFYETAEDYIPWRRFYQQFPSVKALRTGGVYNYCIARTLHQDDGEPDDLAFLPALEEIDLGENSLSFEGEGGSQLAAFQPFVSARQQAGRPVKVFFGP